jgi:hypothetical protein
LREPSRGGQSQILLGRQLLHFTDPPPMTMPYETGGICRRKRRIRLQLHAKPITFLVTF